ncbi:MAG TPA: transcriptional regulator GcvA [Rhodocyclaceae bacterium]
MNESLPPLKALRAFESAARHLSFQKAATELHVTPAAISHQIKLLEDHLGVTLFRRLTRRIQLTESGQQMLPELTQGFASLLRAIDRVRGDREPAALSICVPPLFASKWLMPRLHSFVADHPDLEIRVSTSMSLVDPRKDALVTSARAAAEHEEEIDIAIRFGSGRYPGCRVDKLFDVSFTPLCSPRLLASHPVTEPKDLGQFALLHDDLHHVSDGWANWALWFDAAGIENLARKRGPHFSLPILGLDAAADGTGVVLGARELAAIDIEAGRLVAPFPMSVETGAAYYIASCEQAADDPDIAAFRTWLLREARAAARKKTRKLEKLA